MKFKNQNKPLEPPCSGCKETVRTDPAPTPKPPVNDFFKPMKKYAACKWYGGSDCRK